MLVKTQHSVDLDIVQSAARQLPDIDFRMAINEPTGDFFYSPWKLKDEFKGTVWQTIYDSLDQVKGEARIIKLAWGECYISHSDIDDRYHLNISGDRSFLVDLDNQQMHKTETDGIWYEMDAGRRHSAVNFGNVDRYQLVIRKLLVPNALKKPLHVIIESRLESKDQSRFLFDDRASPWLNRANKQGTISNFNVSDRVSMIIEEDQLTALTEVLGEEFLVKIL